VVPAGLEPMKINAIQASTGSQHPAKVRISVTSG
jgi:hypothetical protein